MGQKFDGSKKRNKILMLARAFTQNKSAAVRAANSYSLTFRPAATKAFSTENAAALDGNPVVRSESLRDRTLRRQELQKLMERWDLLIGFTFHVQMKTDHKMFSSKYKTHLFHKIYKISKTNC